VKIGPDPSRQKVSGRRAFRKKKKSGLQIKRGKEQEKSRIRENSFTEGPRENKKKKR